MLFCRFPTVLPSVRVLLCSRDRGVSRDPLPRAEPVIRPW